MPPVNRTFSTHFGFFGILRNRGADCGAPCFGRGGLSKVRCLAARQEPDVKMGSTNYLKTALHRLGGTGSVLLNRFAAADNRYFDCEKVWEDGRLIQELTQ